MLGNISLRDLIEKYHESIPRYTSYPTAVEFNTGVNSQTWEKALIDEFSLAPKNIALYLHIPFCHSLCYYCACNKIIARDDSQVRPYLEALKGELNAYSSILKKISEVTQFHWGGGTPNFLSTRHSKELFSSFKSAIPKFAKNADISIEIDPRSITSEHLETYRELGFNRISAGVQDFNPQVQEAINRIQSYKETFKTCQEARELGFGSINLDLIYGLPKQTIESFNDTIKKVLTIRPDRIALYGYAHVTWKKKAQKSLQKHDLPSPETRINLFLTALELLTKAGYIYIGMDHFALPEDSLTTSLNSGKLNRNFMGYSTHKNSDVLGFGVSSISSIPRMLAQNTTELDSYIQNKGFNISRGKERNLEDNIRAEIIEGILCTGLVDILEISNKWSINFNSKFENEILKLKKLEVDGLLEIDRDRIKVTDSGRLFMRNIASVFDQYLEQHRQSSENRFSKSI